MVKNCMEQRIPRDIPKFKVEIANLHELGLVFTGHTFTSIPSSEYVLVEFVVDMVIPMPALTVFLVVDVASGFSALLNRRPYKSIDWGCRPSLVIGMDNCVP